MKLPLQTNITKIIILTLTVSGIYYVFNSKKVEIIDSYSFLFSLKENKIANKTQQNFYFTLSNFALPKEFLFLNSKKIEEIFWWFFNKSHSYLDNTILPNLSTTTEENLKENVENIPIFVLKNITWVEKVHNAPWEPRDSGAIFLFQDKIWFAGGLNGSNKINNNIVEYWKSPHFNDIWNSEDGIHWKLVAPSTIWEPRWAPRRSMSVIFFHNQLWMLGGWSPITGYTSDIWISTDGVHWKKLVWHASFEPVEGQTLTVFRNKLWKIGGVNYNKQQTKNTVEYSENGIDWIKVPNIPWEPRWDHAVAVFKGKLFLTGGMNLEGKTFNDVWVSEDGFNWKLITNKAPWAPRQGHSLQVYKGKLWIIGRLNDKENGGPNDVWFSDDGINWEKTNNDPPWTGREDFFSIVFKDKIWVLGGMDSSWQWKNDVWASELPH